MAYCLQILQATIWSGRLYGILAWSIYPQPRIHLRTILRCFDPRVKTHSLVTTKLVLSSELNRQNVITKNIRAHLPHDNAGKAQCLIFNQRAGSQLLTLMHSARTPCFKRDRWPMFLYDFHRNIWNHMEVNTVVMTILFCTLYTSEKKIQASYH